MPEYRPEVTASPGVTWIQLQSAPIARLRRFKLTQSLLDKTQIGVRLCVARVEFGGHLHGQQRIAQPARVLVHHTESLPAVPMAGIAADQLQGQGGRIG